MTYSFSESTSNHDSDRVTGPQSASRRVLIVEDERRLREMLQTSIIEMGLHATAASSGEAALKLVNQQSFALAVIDLNLSGMNGMELCERLHHLKPRIQVIILTGFGDLDAARQAIRLEVVDFLTKPCGMNDLENALNRGRLRWLDRWTADSMNPVTQPIEQAPVPPPPIPAANAQTHRSMEDMERDLILAALSRNNGNRQDAATELGISVRKLYYRIQQYQKLGFLSAD